MAWIEGIPADKAEGRLKELYAQIAPGASRLSPIMMPLTYHPGALEGVSKHGPSKLELGRELAESIAVVVSSANRCAY